MNYDYASVKTDLLEAEAQAYRRWIESLKEKLRMEVVLQAARGIEITLRRAERGLREIEEELARRKRVARRKDKRLLKLGAKGGSR